MDLIRKKIRRKIRRPHPRHDAALQSGAPKTKIRRPTRRPENKNPANNPAKNPALYPALNPAKNPALIRRFVPSKSVFFFTIEIHCSFTTTPHLPAKSAVFAPKHQSFLFHPAHQVRRSFHSHQPFLCFYCLASAGITLFTFFILFNQLFAVGGPFFDFAVRMMMTMMMVMVMVLMGEFEGSRGWWMWTIAHKSEPPRRSTKKKKKPQGRDSSGL